MGIYTFKEVAEKISTPERNVARMVARGVLKASRLGVSSNRIVSEASLEDWVNRGSPDYEEPPIAQNGGNLYEARENNFLMNQIEEWIWKAAADQFLSAQAVDAMYQKDERSHTAKLMGSATLRTALNVALPGPTKIDREAESLQRRFKTRRVFYFAMLLRDEWSQQVRRDINKWKAEKLFESPESYREMTTELMTAVSRRNLLLNREIHLTEAQVARLSAFRKVSKEPDLPPVMMNTFKVTYLLPHSELIDGHEQEIIAAAY